MFTMVNPLSYIFHEQAQKLTVSGLYSDRGLALPNTSPSTKPQQTVARLTFNRQTATQPAVS